MEESKKARQQIISAEITDLEKDIKALEKSKTRKLAILKKKKREQFASDLEDVAPQIAAAAIAKVDAEKEQRRKNKKT